MKETASVARRSLVGRAFGFVHFLYEFLRGLLLANIDLAKLVLSKKRRERIKPGFILYPVEHLSKLEILIISHVITVTPGSATIEVAPDFKTLTLHVLDLQVADEMVRNLQDDLETSLMKWTRR